MRKRHCITVQRVERDFRITSNELLQLAGAYLAFIVTTSYLLGYGEFVGEIASYGLLNLSAMTQALEPSHIQLFKAGFSTLIASPLALIAVPVMFIAPRFASSVLTRPESPWACSYKFLRRIQRYLRPEFLKRLVNSFVKTERESAFLPSGHHRFVAGSFWFFQLILAVVCLVPLAAFVYNAGFETAFEEDALNLKMETKNRKPFAEKRGMAVLSMGNTRYIGLLLRCSPNACLFWDVEKRQVLYVPNDKMDVMIVNKSSSSVPVKDKNPTGDGAGAI